MLLSKTPTTTRTNPPAPLCLFANLAWGRCRIKMCMDDTQPLGNPAYEPHVLYVLYMYCTQPPGNPAYLPHSFIPFLYALHPASGEPVGQIESPQSKGAGPPLPHDEGRGRGGRGGEGRGWGGRQTLLGLPSIRVRISVQMTLRCPRGPACLPRAF